MIVVLFHSRTPTSIQNIIKEILFYVLRLKDFLSSMINKFDIFFDAWLIWSVVVLSLRKI